jgi:ankyrin repeat protein
VLPDNPNLEWLRKESKRRLEDLRKNNPGAKLADAQFNLATEYGFSSWRALKSHIDAMSIEGRLFDAARGCKVEELTALLDANPDKLHARKSPYQWTLLHAAAHAGCLDAVDLLLARGLDPDAREEGDNTYPMHWAAAAGHLDVVRKLIDAGGNVTGRGDDHELEVIGWATCWNGCDDVAHREIVDLLVSRGAKHNIFSAIAMNLADEIRRIVASDPSAINRRLSRNENNQLPLHFAARFNRPAMIPVLLELGADPLAVDSSGQSIASYGTVKEVDRPVMEKIHAMTMSEIDSAARGKRSTNAGQMDLIACLSLRDWETADRLTKDNGELITTPGALHLMAKRGDTESVQWLLDHGANPNALWAHWEADLTPLHLAAMSCSPDVARALVAAGADLGIRDSQFDSDPLGWAEHFQCNEIVTILEAAR